jgi:hypothetical protein
MAECHHVFVLILILLVVLLLVFAIDDFGGKK